MVDVSIVNETSQEANWNRRAGRQTHRQAVRQANLCVGRLRLQHVLDPNFFSALLNLRLSKLQRFYLNWSLTLKSKSCSINISYKLCSIFQINSDSFKNFCQLCCYAASLFLCLANSLVMIMLIWVQVALNLLTGTDVGENARVWTPFI